MSKTKYIDDDELIEIVRQVFDNYIEEDNKLSISRSDMESSLYNNVLDLLKQKNWYFNNLKTAKLINIRNCIDIDYVYKSETTEELLEEYDRLMWSRVNGQYASQTRINKLKKMLGL